MRAALLSLITLTGCFYDSSWGHETTAQKHNAAAAKPASFKSESSGTIPKKAKYTFKMRVWATPQYVSQTLDWQHDFKEVVETANDILLKSAEMRLEIASMSSWPAPPQQDDLEKVLTALSAHDKSEDVEYVVGSSPDSRRSRRRSMTSAPRDTSVASSSSVQRATSPSTPRRKPRSRSSAPTSGCDWWPSGNVIDRSRRSCTRSDIRSAPCTTPRKRA